MKKIIVANWKMCGTIESSTVWAEEVVSRFSKVSAEAEVIVCPPAPLLSLLKNCLSGSQVHLGGQDCHVQAEGAYTGEVSANLLKNVGCEYVIIGHSERRAYCNESNDMVSLKAARAINTGLIPIICIGETGEQRAHGDTLSVITQQIEESVPDEAREGNFILAYEPVWAIGSGKLPTIDEIKQVHTAIITAASERTGVDIEQISVLYGGSVKPDNAGEILKLAEVSGVLVGGASLKADDFIKIIVSL
jgi:triosephosphate isomerase